MKFSVCQADGRVPAMREHDSAPHSAPGFHERAVQRLAFVWPYECLVCSIRFVGFHARYSRRYIKPHFRLAKAAVASK